MPLAQGHSAQARRYNIAKLRREGYPEKQAVAIAYRVSNTSVIEGWELGGLDDDWFITPTDAREALEAVQKSAFSLNLDMQRAGAAGKLPPVELGEWNKWYSKWKEYYAETHGGGFLDWRLWNSTGVLAEAEQVATDLGAWRARYHHFTGQGATTGAPVRAKPGEHGSTWSTVVWGLTAVGSLLLVSRVYSDYIAPRRR